MKSPPKPLSHVPTLNADKLTLALQQLDALNVSVESKAQIRQVLLIAANPGAESPELLMQMLEHDRQRNMAQVQANYRHLNTDVVRRGSVALYGMDEAEFQRLVDEANRV